MRSLTLPALALALATGACIADETMTTEPETGSAWELLRLDGAPFPARATLTFPEPGLVAGLAPCNSFSGDLLAPLPAFHLGPARVTRRACADLPAEGRFFAALGAVTMAAVQGDTLTLSAPGGPEMIFARVQS